MTYDGEISRRSPSAFVILVDQSGSMAEPFGLDTRQSKAQFVADVVNRWIQNLVVRCSRGLDVRDYFDLAVIGYGGAVTSLLGDGGQAQMLPISVVADQPRRIEDRRRKIDDGAGGIVEQTVKFPVWVDPRSEGQTPMCEALAITTRLLEPWLERYPDAFPPTVVNVTDGQSTDGDPRVPAKTLVSAGTSDGHVLLLNCHISASSGQPEFFPAAIKGISDAVASVLFAMSSVVPRVIVDAARREGYELEDGARGFGYQADAAALVQFIEIGTRQNALLLVGE